MVISIRRTSACSTIGRRLPRRGPDRPPLPPLTGVGRRLLVGPLGQRQALEADRQPGVVHHREHVAHAGVGLADEVADRAALVAVAHDAGRAGVDADLVLGGHHPQVVADAGPAVGVEQVLRHDEAGDAAGAGGRVGDAGQHEVDDVVGEVVLAVGDEDLLAGDAPGAVVRRHRSRCARAPTSLPACGSVRFMVPVHSPETSLGSHVSFCSSLPWWLEHVDGTLGQQRAQRERHVRRRQHLLQGERRPPTGTRRRRTPGRRGRRPSRRRRSGGRRRRTRPRCAPRRPRPRTPWRVAGAVQRGEHLAHEPARLLEDRPDLESASTWAKRSNPVSSSRPARWRSTKVMSSTGALYSITDPLSGRRVAASPL